MMTPTCVSPPVMHAAGFVTTGAEDATAKLLCMVNHTNPTGDYMNVEAVGTGGLWWWVWGDPCSLAQA